MFHLLLAEMLLLYMPVCAFLSQQQKKRPPIAASGGTPTPRPIPTPTFVLSLLLLEHNDVDIASLEVAGGLVERVCSSATGTRVSPGFHTDPLVISLILSKNWKKTPSESSQELVVLAPFAQHDSPSLQRKIRLYEAVYSAVVTCGVSE